MTATLLGFVFFYPILVVSVWRYTKALRDGYKDVYRFLGEPSIMSSIYAAWPTVKFLTFREYRDDVDEGLVLLSDRYRIWIALPYFLLVGSAFLLISVFVSAIISGQ